ncbi:glyoxalase [Halobacteriales archaeon QS_1_68_20]|nr:MAG: glyoxalase [Halobacteriales archaeon QS_1_68_20]
METLPDETHVGGVVLSVADLDRVTSFYADVVGLAVQHRTGDRAVLGAGSDELLELRAAPEAPARPPDAAGLYHLAVRFPTRAALAAALGRVREDWQLTGASDHGVSEALYLDDAEDNGVELYRDRPRERWERRPDGEVHFETRRLDLEDLAAAADSSADVPSAGDGGSAGAPPGTDVGHVHLEVTDLNRARAFYVDALGFDVTARVRGALFVSAGDYHHHLGLNTWQGRSSPASGRGLDRVEIALPDEGAVSAAAERLRSAGYSAERTADGVTAADPDGIEIRLVVDG